MDMGTICKENGRLHTKYVEDLSVVDKLFPLFLNEMLVSMLQDLRPEKGATDRYCFGQNGVFCKWRIAMGRLHRRNNWLHSFESGTLSPAIMRRGHGPSRSIAHLSQTSGINQTSKKRGDV